MAGAGDVRSMCASSTALPQSKWGRCVCRRSPGKSGDDRESCASISTVADVDGEVNVQLLDWGDGAVPTGFYLAFDGILQTPNKIVAIVTSHFKLVLQENVSKIKTRILIGVDDTVAPRRVAVRLES